MTTLLLAYGIGYVSTFPWIFRYVLEDLTVGTPEKDDFAFALLATMLTALGWPMLVLIRLVDIAVVTPLYEMFMKGRK